MTARRNRDQSQPVDRIAGGKLMFAIVGDFGKRAFVTAQSLPVAAGSWPHPCRDCGTF